MKLFPLAIILLCPLLAPAQLAVTVSPPKLAGSKAVVKLDMKNKFNESIESARAVCFLLDDQGRMVGQATRWVIGGTKDRLALEPGKEAAFNFVVSSDKFIMTTNLVSRVTFSRVVLESGKIVDVTKEVRVQPATKKQRNHDSD